MLGNEKIFFSYLLRHLFWYQDTMFKTEWVTYRIRLHEKFHHLATAVGDKTDNTIITQRLEKVLQ